MNTVESDFRVIGLRPLVKCADYKGTCFNCQGHVTHPNSFMIVPLGRISEDTMRVVSLEMFECPHCHQLLSLMDVQITYLNLFDKPWEEEVAEEPTENIEKLIETINDGIKEIDKQEDESGEA